MPSSTVRRLATSWYANPPRPARRRVRWPMPPQSAPAVASAPPRRVYHERDLAANAAGLLSTGCTNQRSSAAVPRATSSCSFVGSRQTATARHGSTRRWPKVPPPAGLGSRRTRAPRPARAALQHRALFGRLARKEAAEVEARAHRAGGHVGAQAAAEALSGSTSHGHAGLARRGHKSQPRIGYAGHAGVRAISYHLAGSHSRSTTPAAREPIIASSSHEPLLNPENARAASRHRVSSAHTTSASRSASPANASYRPSSHVVGTMTSFPRR